MRIDLPPVAVTTPGAVIGYRRDGAPIRLLAGGSGETDDAGGDDTGDDAGSDDGGQDATGDTTGDKGENDDQIAKLRREAAKHRTEKQEARAELDRIRKLISGDGDEDPAKVAETLKAERDAAAQEALASRIELDVYRTAQRLGADADRLLDSRGFCDKVDALEVSDPAELRTEIERLVGEHLKAHPGMRAGGAGRSGGEFNGGGGGGSKITEAQLKAMKPAEVDKAYREGRLKHLL